MKPPTEPQPGVRYVAVPATAAEQIAAYHGMPAPRNAAEHKTAAALLGLPLDEPDAHGVTLADRIDAYWQSPADGGPAPQRHQSAPRSGPPLPRQIGTVRPIAPVR